jgi:hypothetical protein
MVTEPGIMIMIVCLSESLSMMISRQARVSQLTRLHAGPARRPGAGYRPSHLEGWDVTYRDNLQVPMLSYIFQAMMHPKS